MNNSPMPPRRIPLSAGEPLRRRTPKPRPRGQLERAAAVRRTVERKRVGARRGVPVPDATRALVWARAGGCCEACGRPVTGGSWSIHHRRPRGAGGSRAADTNSSSNLLLLDGSGTSGCHGAVESERTRAYAYGFLVRQGEDPATIPVLVSGRGFVYLDPAGFYAEGSP